MTRSLESAAEAVQPAGLAFALAAAALLAAGGARAQEGGRELPFGPGEQCVYRGSTRLGRIGTGTMAVEGGEAVNGRRTYLLRFDFSGRFGPARVEDRTRSWFDPAELASYRYTKSERSPLASRSQDVRMDPGARRWQAAGGQGGAMPTAAPLDELSFIYFIRTLRLAAGDAYTLDRHYEAGRNPVVVRVVGRGQTRVPAGTFQTVEVEMRVKDPAHYRGDGVVRLHFTDDGRRVPVRIESSMPVGGRMVLSLESGSNGCDAARLARAD
ncbi:MAG TPA: DUF3108 domain-containing protein [Longimicrobium sp.]|jgi:hypothetical protein